MPVTIPYQLLLIIYLPLLPYQLCIPSITGVQSDEDKGRAAVVGGVTVPLQHRREDGWGPGLSLQLAQVNQVLSELLLLTSR